MGVRAALMITAFLINSSQIYEEAYQIRGKQ
jgi:hypothetical protein